MSLIKEVNMEYVYIGKIVNTHGIKGEIRLLSDFDKKDIVFKKDFIIYIGEGHIKEVINSYRKHKMFDMITLNGYDDINQVLKYKGLNVYVNREDLNLDSNDYLLEDLIGLSIKEDGEVLGKVVEIVYNGSGTLFVVEGTKKFYIPNNKEFILSVNLDENVIECKNTKGLIL
jgi:16S rRNA processing protein RimM